MPRIAWSYVYTVIVGAVMISGGAFFDVDKAASSMWLFGILVIITSFLRIFRVLAPGHQSYEGSTIGFFAGLLLLPFWQFVLLVIIAHSIEWAKERLWKGVLLRSWYIQPFNMAKCIISGGAIHWILHWYPIVHNGQMSMNFVLLTLALVTVYVAMNQILLGIVLYLARGITFAQAGILRDGLLIELPLACIGFITVVLVDRSPLALPFVFAPMALIYQGFMLPKLQDEALSSLEKFNKELTAANQSIRQVNDELFFTLAKVFDARDPFVGGHAAQVASYAVAIANELGLPAAQIETIRQSAYLHDIGKIAIPEAILHKPSRLSEIEYEMVKRHCDIGADFLVSSHGLHHLAPIIRHHHERWDGTGYPDRLAGADIPLESRVLNVCDSVEAMASDRPYHRALSVQEICKEVSSCAGSQFDPEISKAFIRIAEREGETFIVNSARTVAAQFAAKSRKEESPFVKRLAEIYGTVATEN